MPIQPPPIRLMNSKSSTPHGGAPEMIFIRRLSVPGRFWKKVAKEGVLFRKGATAWKYRSMLSFSVRREDGFLRILLSWASGSVTARSRWVR